MKQRLFTNLMQQSRINILALLLLCLGFINNNAFAQTLAPGDIAIIGVNSDLNTINGTLADEISIAILTTITAGTTIYISDYGWTGSAFAAADADGVITWIPSANIPAGSVVKISIASGNPKGTVSGLTGSVTVAAGSWTTVTTSTITPITQAGDNWLIYQGTNATTPTNWIFGFANWFTLGSGNNTWINSGSVTPTISYLPSGLTNGTNAIALTGTGHADNMVYTGIKSGTKSAILSAICNGSNWIGDETNTYDISSGGTYFPSPPNPPFTITAACTAPSITAAASSNTPICSGSTLNLNVGASGTAPLTYAWTGTGTFSNTAVANPSVTGAATGTYSVSVTNSCGTATSSVVVTVNPNVGTPSFTSGATTLCAGGTSTYQATASNSSSVTYSILSGGASIDANTGVVSSVTGNFTVVATASGTCGANTTANRAVTVTPNVGTPSFTSGATTLCAGGTSTYQATASNSSSVTYSILSGGASIDANTGVVSSVTGNFTVVATASGTCGANTTANRAVTVTPNVGTPSFTSGATTLCAGGTSTYQATASNASSVTYSILSGGASIDANTGVVSGVTGDFTVVATASGACGANTTANRAVTVTPNVGTPSFTSGATTLCAGGTSTYQATASNSSSVTYSILSGGASIDANTGVVSSVTGDFTVVATASGACGANTTANRAVTVTPNVGTPSFTSGATTLCAGGTSTYQATASNSSSVTYSILAGGASIDANTGVVSNVTGNFTVVATASGTCGANTTANQAVTIAPNVGTPSFTSPTTTLCAGGTATYTATAANSTNISYSILAGGASIDASTGVVSNVTGNFTVVATASGACGANTTANQAVTIVTGVGTPSFTSGATSLCTGGTSTYQATASNSTSITYSILAGGASINATTGEVSNVTSDFTVVATASGACGANTTANQAVTVAAGAGTPSFTSGATNLCSNATSTYLATATNSTGVTYSIVGGTGASINATTGVVSAITGNFTVRATATGACGANTTADRAVIVPPIVTAPVFTVAPTPICSGVAETYTATATNATSIVYSTLSGSINPTTGVMSGSTGSFTVKATATDVCGISKSTTFPVVVNKSPTLTITNPAPAPVSTTVNITLKPGVISGLYLGTLSYWTDAAASIQLPNPTAVAISGTYYIKADNGSCSRIRPVVVTINTIRIKMSDDNVALIYPNPVENQLHVLPSFPANSQISIYDAQGKVVLKERLSADSENLFSLEAMREGLYIINISDENGNVLHTDKVVKQ